MDVAKDAGHSGGGKSKNGSAYYDTAQWVALMGKVTNTKINL